MKATRQRRKEQGGLKKDEDEDGDGDISEVSESPLSLLTQPTGLPFCVGCPHIYHTLVDLTILSISVRVLFGILRLSHRTLLIAVAQHMFLEGF